MSNLSERDLERLDRVIEELDKTEPDTYSEGKELSKINEDQFNLDVDESRIRFSSATWFDKIQSFDITLGGCGGIGSYVAYLLARLNPYRVALFDDDRVERVNMAGQMFSSDDIGVMKVNALANKMVSYANYHGYVAIPERITMLTNVSNVLLCGFDNMSARKISFERWLNEVEELSMEEDKSKYNSSIFIDGRLAAEEYQVIAIRANDLDRINEYRNNYLFEDHEAEEEICSFKQTAFMANQIASTMINILVNHAANLVYGVEARSVPFFTSYNAATMQFKTE